MSDRRDARPQGLLAIVAVAFLVVTLLLDDGPVRFVLCGAIVFLFFLAMVRIATRHGHRRRWPPPTD
ncbi:MAG: hypothetical protein M3N47_02160 [Chloroflexota bacterium]|nr:hypothetical protein [Chloroflexota bacterium]